MLQGASMLIIDTDPRNAATAPSIRDEAGTSRYSSLAAPRDLWPLLPGEQAIVAPGWTPYRERIRPGDLGPGEPTVTSGGTTLGFETRERPPFKYAAHTRVGFSDTDAQGIVYYGRYMPYFDHARVEYTRHLGLLFNAHGQHEFVMLRARLAYTIARHQLRSLDTLEKLLLQVTRKNDPKLVPSRECRLVPSEPNCCTFSGLSDAISFRLEDGLSWTMGGETGRTRPCCQSLSVNCRMST